MLEGELETESTLSAKEKPAKQGGLLGTTKPFKRAQLPVRSPLETAYGNKHTLVNCPACRSQHPRGACPLKAAGVEHCNLCGLAHYGQARTCPHIRSETQVREMIAALKNSPEDKELVETALKYLRGVKGTLVQQKKKDREKAMALQVPGAVADNATPNSVSWRYPPQAKKQTAQPPQPAQFQGGHQQPLQHAQPQYHAQQPIEDSVVEGALRGYLGH